MENLTRWVGSQIGTALLMVLGLVTAALRLVGIFLPFFVAYLVFKWCV